MSFQSLSSPDGDSLTVERAGRWGALRPLASAARSPCPERRGPALPNIRRNGVARGDDLTRLSRRDGPSIYVAQHVLLAASPAGDDAGQQRRCDVAQRRGVVLAGHRHQAVVAGRQGGIETAGMVGGQEQRLAQHRVAALGRATRGDLTGPRRPRTGDRRPPAIRSRSRRVSPARERVCQPCNVDGAHCPAERLTVSCRCLIPCRRDRARRPRHASPSRGSPPRTARESS